MNSVLQRIAQRKREEIALAKKNKPLNVLLNETIMERRDFIGALVNRETPAIIAEIKHASPSKGLIREDFNVKEIAATYEQHGARCLSVLTDVDFFQGHPDYLSQAKNECKLPILRKDFILDEYQIHESLALGADCILLIVALLDNVQLADFCQLAHELDMAVLVESHDQQELERALRLPTPLIGINNRSLHNFHTDTQVSIQLNQYIPHDRIVITESGINTRSDITMMQSHGINTFLIGESLMRAKDIGKALDQLVHNS
ncbi:indole-3-glycerol phosphate synthase [Legionella wadsworthii]|uniref:Indole-3-glycerol phosphate synthase n=1 Tax=Legionella wadsworthii TaxID=28088 RepID=A0A378LRZ7_9GAMM|nr:indole-3-glycerol phosphate synthase TrpC [Legionella wadsworthii]STY29735.1 indole-3-glycerol phosphate synthase [Legionella wadsworthii]